MQVLELWRFPVKSMQGEQLETDEIGVDGIAGDRAPSDDVVTPASAP